MSSQEQPAPGLGRAVKHSLTGIIDFDFVKNLLFYFKCVFIILAIGGSIAAGWRYDTASQTRFFHFVAVMDILVCLVLLFLYFFKIMPKFPRVPWLIVQLAIDGFFILFYLIASGVCVDMSRKYSNFDHLGAAAFFGFASVLVHILEAIYFFIQWKRGIFQFTTTTTSTSTNAQGVTTTQSSTVTVTKQSGQVVY